MDMHDRRATDGLPDTKLTFIQKNGVKGIAVVILVTLLPYLGTAVENYLDDRNERMMHKEIAPLVVELRNMQYQINTIQNVMLNSTSGVKTLSAVDIDYIARKAVAQQSIKKVNEIQVLLMQMPKPTNGTPYDVSVWKGRVITKIKNILINNSKIYVRDLNRYQHKAFGKVGDHIWKTFPMAAFMENVDEIALGDNRDVRQIGDDIMAYMLSIQETFFDNMLQEMKRAEDLSR